MKRYGFEWTWETIQHYIKTETVFLNVYWSPRYNWNIVEGGVKHHIPITLTLISEHILN
jgi:hypothetical protein